MISIDKCCLIQWRRDVFTNYYLFILLNYNIGPILYYNLQIYEHATIHLGILRTLLKRQIKHSRYA